MGTLSWLGLGIAVLLSNLILVWCGYTWCRRRTRNQVRGAVPAQYFESQIDSMNRVINHIGGCLDTIEQGLSVERDAAPSSVTPSSAPEPVSGESSLGDKSQLYRIASRFARRGSNTEELMADCGLSRGEAQTIANLQSTRVRDSA